MAGSSSFSSTLPVGILAFGCEIGMMALLAAGFLADLRRLLLLETFGGGACSTAAAGRGQAIRCRWISVLLCPHGCSVSNIGCIGQFG
eukprot:COSAG06_NODE_5352_length_3531_cov_95.618007_4_plen_88_part_00